MIILCSKLESNFISLQLASLRVYLPDIDARYLWAYFQFSKTPLLHDQTTHQILKICQAYK